MDKQLQEELKIRKWISNILLEEIALQDNDLAVKQLLGEIFVAAPEDMWNTFVAPFTDVLKAAHVGGKEILSAARLSFDVLTSIRPSTINKARDRYKKRSDALSKEWGEVMKTTDAALEGDAQLLALLVAPQLFLGAKLGTAAASTPGGVVQYLEDSGWHVPLVGDILGIEKDASGAKAAEKAKNAATPLLNKIAGFFFMAHHEPAGPLLTEAEKEDEDKKKPAPEGNSPEAIMAYLEKVGLKDKLEQDARALIKAKEEHINDLMKPFEAQVELLDKIYAAKDLKMLAAALQDAQQAGVDLGGSGLADFEQQINSQVDELLQDEEARKGFVNSYLESIGQKPASEDEKEGTPDAEAAQEVSDEKLKPEIEKVIFMSSTQGMQEQIYTGVQKMKEQIKAEVTDGTPEGAVSEMLKQSEIGKSYLSMVDKAIKKIEAV
jgi:hypothetical protein